MNSFRIIRDSVDIGLFSSDEEMLKFYGNSLDLPHVESVVHSEQYEERFYGIGDSYLKVNYSTETMLSGTSGYRGLILSRPDVSDVIDAVDPDGLPVTLVPSSSARSSSVGIKCVVGDIDGQRQFLTEGLGGVLDGGNVLVGATRFILEEADQDVRASPTWRSGFNYIAVYVDNTRAAHERLLGLGAEHGVRPLRLGDRCIFSWLRDPNGNWIELVQYASLVGPLPNVDTIEGYWPEIVRWREEGDPF